MKIARKIRLTARPMATAAEYDSHPRDHGCLVEVQHGFEPWSGEVVGAQAAAQEAANRLAARLPLNWMACAYIGGQVCTVAAHAVSK
jgi:hypothetical protein